MRRPPRRKTAGLGSNGGLSKKLNSAPDNVENTVRVKFEPNNSAEAEALANPVFYYWCEEAILIGQQIKTLKRGRERSVNRAAFALQYERRAKCRN